MAGFKPGRGGHFGCCWQRSHGLAYNFGSEHLDTIPGVSRDTAEVLLAEMGTDMSRFGDAKRLASWAGMCPGNNESTGKRKSGKTRKGSPWLRQNLIEAAHAAPKTKQTYLSALFHRLVGRRGKKKALLAVGHAILVIAYYLLVRQEAYSDLGANYFDEREHQKVERRLVARLKKLGYDVTLQPVAKTGLTIFRAVQLRPRQQARKVLNTQTSERGRHY